MLQPNNRTEHPNNKPFRINNPDEESIKPCEDPGNPYVNSINRVNDYHAATLIPAKAGAVS